MISYHRNDPPTKVNESTSQELSLSLFLFSPQDGVSLAIFSVSALTSDVFVLTIKNLSISHAGLWGLTPFSQSVGYFRVLNGTKMREGRKRDREKLPQLYLKF